MKSKKRLSKKGVEVIFPEDWSIKVDILGQPVKFTEDDALKISDRRFSIMKLKPHAYVVSGEKLDAIFDDTFIKRLQKTGLSVNRVFIGHT